MSTQILETVALLTQVINAKAEGQPWTALDTQRAQRRHFLAAGPGSLFPQNPAAFGSAPAKVYVSALGGILPNPNQPPGGMPGMPAPGGAPQPGAAPPGGPPAKMPQQAGLTAASEASQTALLAYIDELMEVQRHPEGSPEREEAEQRADMLWSMIHGEGGGEDEGPEQPGDAQLKQALSRLPAGVTSYRFLDASVGRAMQGTSAGTSTDQGSHWTAFRGPRGGIGWQNTQTGRVLYTNSPTPPGSARRQREQSAHRAQSISERVLSHYQAPQEEHAPSEEELQELATHLPKLTIDQLRNTRNRLLASFGGGRRREQMVQALRKHVADLVATRQQSKGRLFPNFPGRDAQAELDAQKRAEQRAKRPAAGGSGLWTGHGVPTPGNVNLVPTGALHVDPERFQFKQNVNKEGVTDELKGVQKFNPDLAGTIAAWYDPTENKGYVVNGHHRYELAKRTGHPNIAVRWLSAKDATEARAKGALINIAEGKGTPIDAAKFMRDQNVGPEDLAKHGVSLKGALARDAGHLRNLSDPLFNRVARGQMEMTRGVQLGQYLPGKHDLQNQLAGYIEKREGATGRDWTDRMVAEAAREVAQSPTQTKDAGGLFGGTEESSRLEERAALKAMVRASLGQQKRDFEAVSSERRAGAVAGAGNVLQVEKNKELAGQHAQAAELFDRVANLKGPVADLINQYAEDYGNASKADRSKIQSELTGKIRALLAGGPEAVGAGGGGGNDNGATGPGAPGAERGSPGTSVLATGAAGGPGPEGQAATGPVPEPDAGLTPANVEDEMLAKGAPNMVDPAKAAGFNSAFDKAAVRAFDPKAQPGQPPPKDRPVTLMFGGSFSPYHTGHTEGGLMKARKHLEDQGYKIGKVVVAPTADKLLRAKLGDDLVPLKDRTEMARRSLEHLPDVDVTSGPGEEAEAFAGKLRRTQLADWAARHYPGTSIVNVTGEDAAPGTPPGFPSIYAGDKGSSHEGYYYAAMPRDMGAAESISSSKIRRAIAAGQPVPEGWMHPEAEKYYREYLKHRAHEKERAAAAVGQPAHIPSPDQWERMDGLNDQERQVETTAWETATKDYAGLRKRYLEGDKDNPGQGRVPDGKGGYQSITLNTDEWRHLLPGYEGTNASAVHEPSSWLNKQLYSEALRTQKGKGNGQMLILAGGGGSGKGSTAPKHLQMNEYPIVLDQTSDSFPKLEAKLDEAIKAGYKPAYAFVDRAPAEALGGVVGRALKQEKEGKPPRTVEMHRALHANINARRAALELFKRRPQMQPMVLRSDAPVGERPLIVDRDEAIKHLEAGIARDEQALQGGLLEQIQGELAKRHESGEISEKIARGLMGHVEFEKRIRRKEGPGNPPASTIKVPEEVANGQPSQSPVPGQEPVPADNSGRAVPGTATAPGQPELPGVAGSRAPGPAAQPAPAASQGGAGGQGGGAPGVTPGGFSLRRNTLLKDGQIIHPADMHGAEAKAALDYVTSQGHGPGRYLHDELVKAAARSGAPHGPGEVHATTGHADAGGWWAGLDPEQKREAAEKVPKPAGRVRGGWHSRFMADPGAASWDDPGSRAMIAEAFDLAHADRPKPAAAAAAPAGLKYGHDQYFEPGGQNVKLDQLQIPPITDQASHDAAVGRAAEHMRAAAAGGSKRPPISATKNPDGTYSVKDGAATIAQAKANGWPDVPVRVAEPAAAIQVSDEFRRMTDREKDRHIEAGKASADERLMHSNRASLNPADQARHDAIGDHLVATRGQTRGQTTTPAAQAQPTPEPAAAEAAAGPQVPEGVAAEHAPVVEAIRQLGGPDELTPNNVDEIRQGLYKQFGSYLTPSMVRQVADRMKQTNFMTGGKEPTAAAPAKPVRVYHAGHPAGSEPGPKGFEGTFYTDSRDVADRIAKGLPEWGMGQRTVRSGELTVKNPYRPPAEEEGMAGIPQYERDWIAKAKAGGHDSVLARHRDGHNVYIGLGQDQFREDQAGEPTNGPTTTPAAQAPAAPEPAQAPAAQAAEEPKSLEDYSHYELGQKFGGPLREAIRKAPSFEKLKKAAIAHIQSLHGKDSEQTAERIKEYDAEPESLLTAHGGVMNAKSARAKSLQELARAVIKEANVPTMGKKLTHGYRGDYERVDWHQVAADQNYGKNNGAAGPAPEPAKAPETKKEPGWAIKDMEAGKPVPNSAWYPEGESPAAAATPTPGVLSDTAAGALNDDAAALQRQYTDLVKKGKGESKEAEAVQAQLAKIGGKFEQSLNASDKTPEAEPPPVGSDHPNAGNAYATQLYHHWLNMQADRPAPGVDDHYYGGLAAIRKLPEATRDAVYRQVKELTGGALDLAAEARPKTFPAGPSRAVWQSDADHIKGGGSLTPDQAAKIGKRVDALSDADLREFAHRIGIQHAGERPMASVLKGLIHNELSALSNKGLAGGEAGGKLFGTAENQTGDLFGGARGGTSQHGASSTGRLPTSQAEADQIARGLFGMKTRELRSYARTIGVDPDEHGSDMDVSRAIVQKLNDAVKGSPGKAPAAGRAA